ncbi:MAG: hypothetical protein CUN54_03115 [Phototrophicales bacterium]|nr:MAG: hypothetical protein CUN54_03115 [Phototrophicales bacterium]
MCAVRSSCSSRWTKHIAGSTRKPCQLVDESSAVVSQTSPTLESFRRAFYDLAWNAFEDTSITISGCGTEFVARSIRPHCTKRSKIMPHLTAIILTYNEERHITACVASVQFADAVIVFDSHSQDNTVKLAENAGAQVIQNTFENYAQQRNAALEAVKSITDWVLFVDADERVTPELADEVRQVIELPGYAGWCVPRHNYIFGKLTLGGGWYPDCQMRLLKVGQAYFDPTRHVHEVAVLDGDAGLMRHHFVHYNYDDARQFHQKQRKYIAYDAQILFQRGVCPRFHNFILQPLRQFWWRFVTLKAYRDGLHGLRLSVYMGFYEWVKYRLLAQMCQQKRGEKNTPVDVDV